MFVRSIQFFLHQNFAWGFAGNAFTILLYWGDSVFWIIAGKSPEVELDDLDPDQDILQWFHDFL